MAAGWRNPRFDLKEKSKNVFDQAMALSLGLITMTFLTYQTFEVRAVEMDHSFEAIELEEIPETVQLKKPPPPQRPQIPIATESEDIPEDVTIMDTDLDLDAPPPPPPPPPGARQRQEDSPIFMAWEEAPELIRSTQVKPEYPPIARKAGVEGKVILQIVIDEQGNVLTADVVFSQPSGIFEEAAIKAIMQWKFKPAKQRDKPIKVRMAWPMEFSLKERIPPVD
jgi:protein TonB